MLNISFDASQSFNIDNSVFSSALHFLLQLFVSLESKILGSLYILGISPIPDGRLGNDIFPIYWLPFCSIESVL